MSEQMNKVCANLQQDFTDAQKAQARANIGAVSSTELTNALATKQDTLTAGPNIDIINNVISTEKTVVSAGSGVTITSSQEPQTRVTTYEISSSGTTYNVFTTTEDGLTPKSGANTDKFLKGDGTWATPQDTTYSVFTSSTDGLVPKANSTGDDAKFLRGDHTWQPPMTGVAGDQNHPNYISVDAYGNLHYAKTKRLFWEFTFSNPSAVLTATDISNGFVELVFPLGADGLGLGIMSNGNMVCMKGYSIEMGNSLNGRQMSFYILAHNGTSPRWLMDTGFTTYTESVVNNYDWKAFKAIGLCADRNASLVDAVLRVPLTTETAGQTFQIPGHVCVSVFGVASGD